MTPGLASLSPGDRVVELMFDSRVEDDAVGMRDCTSILVYLRQGHARRGFCMHVHPDPCRGVAKAHRYWNMRSIPDKLVCPGRQNRAINQLSRSLWKYAVTGEPDSVDAVKNVMSGWIDFLPRRCITCGIHQGIMLYRPTVCRSARCVIEVRKSALEVRLMDVRQDPFVVELLLTAVYAAAQANDMTLLPGCPEANSLAVLTFLDTIPPIGSLSNVLDLDEYSDSVQHLRLLCWACSEYRGFLTFVMKGAYHVDELPPQTEQFMLADAGPDLESNFNSAMPWQTWLQPRETVYFHGTTLDRLYSILNQGLRVLSFSPLMGIGARYGPGIYLSDSPNYALLYTRSPKPKIHNRTRNMLFYRYRVLLCCEVASAPVFKEPKIFVMTNEKAVILRYFFLLPPEGGNIVYESQMRSTITANLKKLRTNRG